jgi:hypothetical protein
VAASDKSPLSDAGSGASGRRSESSRSPTRPISAGAKVHAHYQDRHEEYIPVTKDDLQEVRTFGWLQQSLFGTGTFFFSGAFWLLMELLSREPKFTAFVAMCILSMAFGAILGAIGLVMFAIRQRRLNKYFEE